MVGINYLRGMKTTLIFVVSNLPMEMIRGLILLVKYF